MEQSIDILALIGIIILVGFFMGRLMRRFEIPQVVGYIVTGLLLGPSLPLHLIPPDFVNNLDFVKELALGVIGFEMGLHLRFKVLRRLGRSITAIVLLQAIAPFTLVALAIYIFSNNLALALLLGVLATATAPAATMEVLEEYESGGPLTTSIVAVVGIDDALALITFSIVVPLVETTFGGTAPSIIQLLEVPFIEIGGSILLGLLIGYPVARFVDANCDQPAAQIAVAAGAIFLCAGFSEMFHLSLILTTMTLGTFIANLTPSAVGCMRDVVEQVGPLLYILFFAMVGARFEVLELFVMETTLLLALAYTVTRIVGKIGGAWTGGVISNAAPTVRRNIGIALLSQGGVAIGLALSIDDRFAAYGQAGVELGAAVVTIITATTFVMEIAGPILVKVAIDRAGETGQANHHGQEEEALPAT